MNAAIVLKNKRNSRFGPALEWAFSKEMDDPKVAQILYFASRRGNNFSVLDLNDILIQYKRYLKIRYGKWRAVVDRLPVVSVKPSEFKNSGVKQLVPASYYKKRIKHSKYGFYDNDREYVPRKNAPPAGHADSYRVSAQEMQVQLSNHLSNKRKREELDDVGPEDNDDDI